MTMASNLLSAAEYELLKLKAAKLKLLEAELAEKKALPHRHLFKHYTWSQEFYDDVLTRIQLLVAANQVSKSSTQIRKVIELATNKTLWPQAWPKQHKTMGDAFTPNLFLYFYPSMQLATIEFEFKWKQFLPKMGDDHPIYGWKATYDQRKLISELRFNSGVTILFKAYSQEVINLQAMTPFFIGIDEEPPVDMLGEIMARLNSSDGLLSIAFTATLGQTFFKEVVEDRTRWKEARVWQVSLYDCLQYADGSQTHWTEQGIEQIKSRCSSEKEILMRVYGRFVKADGLAVPNFESKNRCKPERLLEIKKEWPRYVGIDYGSGGETGHPSAIVFIACRPDFTEGFVYKCWRGDKILTSAGDVIDKFLEMRGPDLVYMIQYDFAARDLATMGERVGLAMTKAKKDREAGFALLNSLFKNMMLWLPEDTGQDHQQFDKLAGELEVYSINSKLDDDLLDSFRYGCMLIPWQFSYEHAAKVTDEPRPIQDPRKAGIEEMDRRDGVESVDDEIDYWNGMFE